MVLVCAETSEPRFDSEPGMLELQANFSIPLTHRSGFDEVTAPLWLGPEAGGCQLMFGALKEPAAIAKVKSLKEAAVAMRAKRHMIEKSKGDRSAKRPCLEFPTSTPTSFLQFPPHQPYLLPPPPPPPLEDEHGVLQQVHASK